MNFNLSIRNKRCSGNRRRILYSLFKKITPDLSVVDVGCGTLANEFALDFRIYKGIDIPDSYNSSFFSGQNITFFDFTDGKLPKIEGADLLLCLDLLEHVEEPRKLLQTIVKTGVEQIIISLPNNWSGMGAMYRDGNAGYSGYGFPFEGFKPGQRHYFFFNAQEAILFMVQAASKFKFTIRDVAIDYRKGADGPIFWTPYVGRALRIIITASRESYCKHFGKIIGNLFFRVACTVDFLCLIVNDFYSLVTLQPRGSMKHINKYSSGVYFNIQPNNSNIS